MLSALAVFAAITALLAGIAGAWSPCGFSIIDTIGTNLGDPRRSVMLLTCATFTLGAVVGGALTFGGLSLAGALIGTHAHPLREALGALLATAAAIADWRGVKIAPQIRRQVPERWRWTLPLPLACGLYGVLLGLGFTTFVLAFAVWALAGISFAAGSLSMGLLVGVAFGVGRALPVVWMAPGFRSGDAQRRMEEMASEPRLWLGMRRLDALGLGLCALFLGGSAASAANAAVSSRAASAVTPLRVAGAAVLRAARTDPSAAGGALAWQQPGGPGMLRLASGQLSVLPGTDPALGPTTIAWQSGGQITVAQRDSMATRLTLPAPGLTALAVSDSWVVYRQFASGGRESLIGVSLANPGVRRDIDGPVPEGQIGRPALDGSTVVFAFDTPRSNRIAKMSLASGARGTLRSSSAGYGLLNPSLLEGRLLYERVSRCAQELRVGPAHGTGHERVLLRLRSAVQRDPGYQRGYEHAYNSASLCPGRKVGGSGRTLLGPTALGTHTAYVTETSSALGRSRIAAVSR